MDALTLAATSFIIAVSLLITDRKDKPKASFIGLCLAIFVSQTGVFLQNYFSPDFWTNVEYIGILAIAPFAFRFFRHLTHNRSMLRRSLVLFAIIMSFLLAFFISSPLGQWQYFHTSVLAYTLATLGICYVAILRYEKKLPLSVEKKRLHYLLFACPIAVILCGIDLLKYIGFNFPPITGFVLSSLLYFILLIIAYPQLNELHDFFARALVICVSTICGIIIFYFVIGFSKNTFLPSFTSVMMASFLIVISVTPIKIILQKVYTYF